MSEAAKYIEELIEKVKVKNPGEVEFHQTIEEVLHSLVPVLEQKPEYITSGLMERLVEPERQIMFRVPWVDDAGKPQVNRGFRVQFNSAIGPYKGGLRFHPTVYLGIVKFLGFEQIFKNSLTGLPIGGSKGGSDFDASGKSDAEIMRFCQSFMTELYRHIGPDLDIPAGDIGVGAREVGYLFGQYKRIVNQFHGGVITGKGLTYGGSKGRREATGHGIVYFCENMLNYFGTTIKGMRVAGSGFGNVSWGMVDKATELGAKVVTISGPDGYIIDEDGVGSTEEKLNFMTELRASGKNIVKPYADKFGVKFVAGKRPWELKVDCIIPCATQNEIRLEDAKQIVANGVKYVCEGSNMSSTNDAIKYMQENGVVVGPCKAANAAGVGCSALEMSQNSMRLSWSEEEVDEKVKAMMKNIFDSSAKAAKQYGFGDNIMAGANIAGFLKVAEAMMAQGHV